MLVEGVRAVGDALAAGAPIRWVACAPRVEKTPGGPALTEELRRRGVDMVWLEDEELEAVSDTESPQGILMVVEEPRVSLGRIDSGARRFVLADGIQDPGNLGTLVRASLAFGVDAFVALDGTVDPWGPKAVRSAAGACFGMPVAQASWTDVRSWLEGRAVPILVATAAGSDVARVEVGDAWALAVGSEARGVRPDLDARAAQRVAVPMPGGGESLNAGVAGGILLYVLTRNT